MYTIPKNCETLVRFISSKDLSGWLFGYNIAESSGAMDFSTPLQARLYAFITQGKLLDRFIVTDTTNSPRYKLISHITQSNPLVELQKLIDSRDILFSSIFSYNCYYFILSSIFRLSSLYASSLEQQIHLSPRLRPSHKPILKFAVKSFPVLLIYALSPYADAFLGFSFVPYLVSLLLPYKFANPLKDAENLSNEINPALKTILLRNSLILLRNIITEFLVLAPLSYLYHSYTSTHGISLAIDEDSDSLINICYKDGFYEYQTYTKYYTMHPPILLLSLFAWSLGRLLIDLAVALYCRHFSQHKDLRDPLRDLTPYSRLHVNYDHIQRQKERQALIQRQEEKEKLKNEDKENARLQREELKRLNKEAKKDYSQPSSPSPKENKLPNLPSDDLLSASAKPKKGPKSTPPSKTPIVININNNSILKKDPLTFKINNIDFVIAPLFGEHIHDNIWAVLPNPKIYNFDFLNARLKNAGLVSNNSNISLNTQGVFEYKSSQDQRLLATPQDPTYLKNYMDSTNVAQLTDALTSYATSNQKTLILPFDTVAKKHNQITNVSRSLKEKQS